MEWKTRALGSRPSSAHCIANPGIKSSSKRDFLEQGNDISKGKMSDYHPPSRHWAGAIEKVFTKPDCKEDFLRSLKVGGSAKVISFPIETLQSVPQGKMSKSQLLLQNFTPIKEKTTRPVFGPNYLRGPLSTEREANFRQQIKSMKLNFNSYMNKRKDSRF